MRRELSPNSDAMGQREGSVGRRHRGVAGSREEEEMRALGVLPARVAVI